MIPSSRTVLIVDDSSEDRELHRRYLLHNREYSYTILEAALGQQGLELWQRHQPDVVLLDYRLPDLDGLEFLAQLQSLAQQPCLPVIVVTGQGNEVIAVQAMKAGAQDYLIKEQITPTGLQLAISGVIETVQLRIQLQQRIERERLISQITQKIHQTLNLEEILQTTVTEVRQFLHTDRVIVFRLFPDGNGIVIAESVKAEWQALLSSTIYDPCLIKGNCKSERPEVVTPEVVTPEIVAYDPDFNENYVERYRQGWVTAKADIYDGSIDPCHVELLERFQVKANLVVPILHEDQCWGLLIAHHCAAPRQWQALEIDLLQQLGTQVNIALRQAELYQQSQQELAERQYAEEALHQANEELQMTVEELRIAQEELLTQNENLEQTYKMVNLERQRYEDLFNFAPDGYLTTDLIGVIQEANWTAAELLAVDRQDLIGQIFFTYVSSQAIPALSNHLNESRRSRQKQTWESTLVSHGEGQPFSVEITVLPIQDEQDRVVGIRWLVRDITQRQQIETVLRESEAQLRSALIASRMGTWDWNIQIGQIRWSDNLEALWGLEPGEFDGTFEMFLSRIHPDDRDRIHAAIDHAIATGEDYEVEFRVVYPNGRIRWALSQGKVFYDQDGQPVQMAGNDIDITDRRQAEDRLRESEERFRQLAENINVVFWIREVADNRVSYISPAYEQLWGLDPQELYETQQSWIRRIHPDDQLWVDQAFQEKASVGQFDEQYRIVLADNSIRWVHDRCFPLYNQTGELYRFTGIAEDITDRKRVEQILRLQAQVLDQTHDSVVTTDLNGDITSWNYGAEKMFGYKSEEVMGQPISMLYPTEKREFLNSEVIAPLKARGEHEVEVVAQCKSGELIDLLLSLSLLRDEHQNPTGMIGFSMDITDRKQAEAALRQSEEFKRRMLESSSDCIKLLNLDGQLLYINTGGLCLLEIDDLTPYINTEWANFWPENDRRIAEEAVATARMGELSRFQGFCPTAKGTPKWWDVVVTPIQDTLGQVVQLLVTSRDITERKQSEEALRDSEERFRTLADNMSQFAWMADAGGDIFWYNQRWFDYTGTTLEEMRGWGWQKVHHPDHVERVVQHIRHCFETGQLWEDTFPLRGQDGQYRWFLSRAIPIRDQNNKIICWFGTNTDIDDRKQVEEALRQSEERYRCLAELIPQLVWTASPAGALLDVNQRWSNFTGVSLEQVQAGGWEQVVHPEDLPVLIQEWTEAVRQEIPYQAEGRMRRADGVYRWHLHQAIPQNDEQGQIVKWFGTATDIETQKQLEGERDRLLQQEQLARAEAERANRIKDDFLAILSHELRSPLNPILGWAKLLQTRTFEPAKTAEALATIERNAKLQTQLIDDLLDVAKILRGKLSLTVVPIDLTFVIEAAIDTVRTAALAKDIQLHSVLPQIGQVSGDATRLQQIVWNLLSNAIKFTPRNGRVDIRLECVDQQAQLTVSDTGKGISPDFLPHIFESFRQEDASTTRRYGGLGLGLAIVRHLVEAHGGTIWADSLGEDQGAKFTVQLPLIDVEPEQSQIGELPEQELDLTGIRALVVDDEPDARELLTAVLTQYGAEVLTVTSATEVLANLESFQPNVLVSDLGMPDVDGYALMQQIRTLPAEQGGQVPAIALTAYAREEDYQRTISSGFQRHIAKPLEPTQLVQAIMALAPHQ